MQALGVSVDLAPAWPMPQGKGEAQPLPQEPEGASRRPSTFAQELNKWAPSKVPSPTHLARPDEALVGPGGLALEGPPAFGQDQGWALLQAAGAAHPNRAPAGLAVGSLVVEGPQVELRGPDGEASSDGLGAASSEALVSPLPWAPPPPPPPVPVAEESSWLRVPGVVSVQASLRPAAEGPVVQLRFELQSPELGQLQLQVHHQQGQVGMELLAPHPEGVLALQQRVDDIAAVLRSHGLVPTQLKVAQLAAGQSGRGAGFSSSDGRQAFGSLRRPRGAHAEALEAEALS